MAKSTRTLPAGVLILTVLLGAPLFVTATGQRPNFSGTWVDDRQAKPAEGATTGNGAGLLGAVVAGSEVTIVHGATLRVTRLQGGRELIYNIELDGRPNGYTVQALGGSLKQMSKAAWVGERLEITTTVNRGTPEVWTTKQAFSLKDGNLVVETVGATHTQTVVYRKKR